MAKWDHDDLSGGVAQGGWGVAPPSAVPATFTTPCAQSAAERKAILTAVEALLTFGAADAIAYTLPRIELARKLLKEII